MLSYDIAASWGAFASLFLMFFMDFSGFLEGNRGCGALMPQNAMRIPLRAWNFLEFMKLHLFSSVSLRENGRK